LPPDDYAKKTENAKRPFTLGVYRIGGVGDALLASCAIKALKRFYDPLFKEIRVYAYSHSTVATHWKNHPDITIFDTHHTPRINGIPVRKAGIDAFYNLMPDGTYNFSERVPHKHRLGVERAFAVIEKYKKQPGNYNHLTAFCRDNDFDALDVYNYLFGINCSVKDMHLPITPHDQSYMSRQQLLKPYNYISIHDWAFAGRQTKSWFPAYWKDLKAMLYKEFGVPVVQIGGRAEESLHADIDLRGKTTFGESIELMRHSLFHIDNESTPAHVCAALDVPCVVLHGPTNRYWRHKENLNIKSDHPCQECEGAPDWWRNCIEKSNCACMKKITPEFVLQKITTKDFMDRIKTRNAQD